ncbi:helix-turn-helix domain-containing protein [Treponema primitia]|uniref:helix-turn-helix domain-containing protein n=1 Tax=Treponema primitia TaxID=88058 RepID=UPI00397EDB84
MIQTTERPPVQPLLYNIKDTAKILNCAEITLRRQVAKKNIPHHKIGDRILFTKRDIEDYLTFIKCRSVWEQDAETIRNEATAGGATC